MPPGNGRQTSTRVHGISLSGGIGPGSPADLDLEFVSVVTDLESTSKFTSSAMSIV
jgi:hypothetical protein